MYHAIVKRIARKNFLRVNNKDFDALLKDCVPNIYHRFGGNHALGGERHDREALRAWFGRLGRLAQHLTLSVEDIWVQGLPNDTTIIIRWSATDVPPDGSSYRNHGVHQRGLAGGRREPGKAGGDGHRRGGCSSDHKLKAWFLQFDSIGIRSSLRTSMDRAIVVPMFKWDC
jgi:ketosteroid isomerase-like protein